LQNLHKHFSEKGESSIIGSASYSLSAPHLISFAGIKSQNRWRLKYYKYLPSFTAKNPNELSGLVPSVVLPTRGMLVSSAIMQKVNYLDEKMFPQYASDYDFVLRAAKAGAKIYVSYDAYLFENMQLTSSGNPRLAKTFKSYLKNVFLNKYSSNYFYNQTNMAWRHGFKFLFPYYFLLTLVAIPYIYMKYKHTALSSQVKNKN
jgi:GT2 family glycosyltransferase